VGLGGSWVLLRAKGCVGSTCNHNLGGAGPCRVGGKVGLGGVELEKGGAGRDLLAL
jgi:hypothetical protein